LLVGLYTPVVTSGAGLALGNGLAARSSSVSVTLLIPGVGVGVPGLGEGAEPPESDMMMAVVCPSGPISNISISAGLPWVMLFSFTVTLVIEPGIPATVILEG
jgi:hypothetical protein